MDGAVMSEIVDVGEPERSECGGFQGVEAEVREEKEQEKGKEGGWVREDFRGGTRWQAQEGVAAGRV